jgi:hypothetical protein
MTGDTRKLAGCPGGYWFVFRMTSSPDLVPDVIILSFISRVYLLIHFLLTDYCNMQTKK